jgi:hypothetical protein
VVPASVCRRFRRLWPPVHFSGQRYGLRPNRPWNVLLVLLTQIDECCINPVSYLPIGVFREANSSWFADAFEARGWVDAIAHQIAIAFLDYVANMDADTKDDLPLRWQSCIPLGDSVLDFKPTPNGVHHTAKLYEDSSAGSFENAAVMNRHRGIDQVRSKTPQCSDRALIV